MNLYLDIETVPSDRADIREYVASSVTPPGTMKKAETIAKWEAEEKPQAIEDALAKCSFDGAFGRVVCVCFAVDGDDVIRIHGSDEGQLLTVLGAALTANIRRNGFDTKIIGHHIGWDVRFLYQRYICLDIPVPAVIRRAVAAKPWDDEKVFDTMVQFAGVGNRISLDKLCLAMGIPSPKGEMDGSMVWDYFKAGRLEEIATYCAGDVETVRKVHQRMIGHREELSLAA